MEAAVTVNPVSIEVSNLHKSYGKQEVLKGVSFSVKPGEIFVLMGPSGSGKSVLLRHLVGLEHANSGEVLLDKEHAASESLRERVRTALVFQAGALFNSMTVYDNLALYLREHRLYKEPEIREKVRSVAGALSIENALEKIPAELSGGMRKRVAVARAILMEPQVIFYDEPTSELDPILAATTSELIGTVSRETGATSLVVTHDRDLAMSIGHRVALLMHGEIIFEGTPAEFKSCEDERVKEFLNPKINLEKPRFRNQEENL